MRGKSRLLRGILRDSVRIRRKRSGRSCPYDLESLDSEFGQLNLVQPRSGHGPHVLATWVSKFPRPRDAKNLSDPRHYASGWD
jgi:hypothetical protein